MLDQMTLDLLAGGPSENPNHEGRWLAAARTAARTCPPMLHPQRTRTTVIAGARTGVSAVDAVRQFVSRRNYHFVLRQLGARVLSEMTAQVGLGNHQATTTSAQPQLVQRLEVNGDRAVISIHEDGAGGYVSTLILVTAGGSGITMAAIVESGRSPCATCSLEALRTGLVLERPAPEATLRALGRPNRGGGIQQLRLIRPASEGLESAMLAYLPNPRALLVRRVLQDVVPRSLSRRTVAAMASPPFVRSGSGGSPLTYVIATGTELLLGRDRNRPYLSRELRRLGLQLGGSAIVPDDEAAIIRLLASYTRAGARLIITTGGTGATRDDTTVGAVARFGHRRLVHDPALEDVVLEQEVQERRGRTGWEAEAMFEAARRQSRVPEGSTWLRPAGTAPGFVVVARRPGSPVIVVLPGPPSEVQAMWEQAVQTPEVQAVLAEAGHREIRELRLLGQEADLQRWIDAICLEDPELAKLEIGTFWDGGEELRVVAWFDPADQRVFDRFVQALHARVDERLYSIDGRTIEEMVASLLQDRSVATVESGTTGGIRSLLRLGGAIAPGGLKISAADPTVLLRPRGTAGADAPPSPELAREHALVARELLRCDIGIGVAGPGRTLTDPTDLYVCIHDGDHMIEKTLTYPPDERAIVEYPRAVLHLLRAHLRRTH